jgi:hypothetical protein
MFKLGLFAILAAICQFEKTASAPERWLQSKPRQLGDRGDVDGIVKSKSKAVVAVEAIIYEVVEDFGVSHIGLPDSCLQHKYTLSLLNFSLCIACGRSSSVASLSSQVKHFTR